MLRVGEYRFSVGDARKTLQLFDVLWAGLVGTRDASVVADLRSSADAALAAIDLSTAFEHELGEVLPTVWHALLAAGPAYRARNLLPRRREGRVAHLATSGGGVPKTSVPSAEIGFRGVHGDRQAARVHHGRPFQALCLWSTEVIDGFRTDGHGVFPGAAGENITVSGLPWAEVTPGTRLRLGSALCEISAYATPCFKNARWFRDGQYELMHERRGPVSRAYATVLEPGSVTVGDAAVLEP